MYTSIVSNAASIRALKEAIQVLEVERTRLVPGALRRQACRRRCHYLRRNLWVRKGKLLEQQITIACRRRTQ